jgi:nucleotide-binding universal stress UspA family protein
MSPSFLEMRRILVPVDFSDAARPVAEYARDMARDRGASLTLLHVVGVPSTPLDPAYGVAADPKILRDLQDGAARGLEELAESVRKAGVPVETKVLLGAPSREIVRAAREGGADLVVIGTHGRTGLRHVFLGSVAENVVRLCPCPVLTLRLKGFELEKV